MKRQFQLGMSKESATIFSQMKRATAEGGARLNVKENSDKAETESREKGIPFILAKLYAPSPIVNMDQTRNAGVGMVPRLYLPIGETGTQPRTFGDKLGNWFSKGVFK